MTDIHMLREMVVARGLLPSSAEARSMKKPALARLIAEDDAKRLGSRGEWTRLTSPPMFVNLAENRVYAHIVEVATNERDERGYTGLPAVRAVVLQSPGAQDQLVVEVLGNDPNYDDLDRVEASVLVQHDAANTVRQLRWEGMKLHFLVDRDLHRGEGEARHVDLGGYEVFARESVAALP